jgi:cell division protein FtsB
VAKARAAAGGSTTGRRIKQGLIAAAVVAALVFAVQGGEYGTRDLLRLRARKQRLIGSIDSLQHVVDSLKRLENRIENDPALQERIAREEYGFVRGGKERLYRFAEPDSAIRTP